MLSTRVSFVAWEIAQAGASTTFFCVTLNNQANKFCQYTLVSAHIMLGCCKQVVLFGRLFE